MAAPQSPLASDVAVPTVRPSVLELAQPTVVETAPPKAPRSARESAKQSELASGLARALVSVRKWGTVKARELEWH